MTIQMTLTPNYAMPVKRLTKILFKYFVPHRMHHNVYVIEPSKVVLYGAKFKNVILNT